MVGATHPLQHETITPRSATTTHTPPIDQPTTAQQCSSTYGSTPVREEHLIASRVLRSRSPARNAGRFVILRPPMSGIASEPPLTKHPPPTHRPTHHSSTTAVQPYAPQQYPCWYTTSWLGWGFPLSYDSPPSGGEREPSPGEAFHAPRSPSWGPSAVMLPETPRAHVWGGRGTGVRSLGDRVVNGRAGYMK